MITGKGFEILVADLPDYDNLVAEVYWNGKFFALISKEEQHGAFQLNTPTPEMLESEITHSVDLQGFVEIVEQACNRLNPTKKENEEKREKKGDKYECHSDKA